MNAWGFIIGTATLWILKSVSTMLTGALFGMRKQEVPLEKEEAASEKQEAASEKQEAASEKQEAASEKQEVAPEKQTKEVEVAPTGPFILMDVLVCGAAGFLIGWLSGWYMIGLSWKPVHWPGMIALIGLSVFGSELHG